MQQRAPHMSEKNKAILQQANAAVVAGDYERFLSHCTDDVVWTFVGEQTLNGKAAVRRYIEATYVEPPRFAVERMIAEGEFVMAMGDISLKDEAGNVVHYKYCDVWRIEGGKLAALKAFVVEIKTDVSQGVLQHAA
jgi:ketosteroid isomerase-like protein